MARKLKLKLGKDEDKEEIMQKVGSQLLKDKIVQLIDESKPISRANLSVTSKFVSLKVLICQLQVILNESN